MSGWQLAADLPAAAQEVFADLDRVFALEGEWIAGDQMSKVLRVAVNGRRYYVKQYWGAGKGLRRWLGRPRVKAEWQNLRLFAKWGIPTAPVVAWGLERRFGCFARGALITAELADTEDLAALARNHDPRLQQRDWLDKVSRQLAEVTRLMHQHGFAHNDLKWRNLLVDEGGDLYLIDCPTGSFWWGPLLDYRIIKDLACLDKVAKYHLPRTRRLRFYLQYRGRQRLSANDKRRVRKILAFFEGRE
ncbi:Lipopolysaccharide kinase (Kdo/WaaP) family protein [Geopseudomonas sagittaria]|uniref:Lipopolysaccharide kinase (Kdo/WaaP) family protein n=1 Tax=Geopseudomonas sagittaria TaxID=1135990 RepID=A0A1I5SYN2_9GAMM|nr:lipopolysaccharide kinase InaA family protein [Pseudomonas sagittaria]SFP75873.1 Lipopolysaccharide kinase (Kdo/WaaP) family protein [Pseudomonas sagittaria]